MVNPPPIELGTFGIADSLFLMVLALVVFGPRRLPQIAKQLGKLMYEFRKASNDFKFQMEEELRLSEEADRRKKEEAERARLQAVNPPAQTIESQTAIGAQESVSAPSHPLYGSGTSYTEQPATEAASATADEPPPTVPRIQPPSTGVTVPAGRRATWDTEQGSGIRDQESEEQGPRDQGTEGPGAAETAAAEANLCSPLPATTLETPASAQPQPESQPDSTRTETVTQHG